MCYIPQTDTGLIIQDGFKQPNTLEGKMKHDHVPTESNNRISFKHLYHSYLSAFFISAGVPNGEFPELAEILIAKYRS
jgi:hypothetical protein